MVNVVKQTPHTNTELKGTDFDIGEIYETLYNKAVEGLLVFDHAGKVCRANPSAGEIFNYSNDELLKLGIDDLLPASLLDNGKEILENIISKPDHTKAFRFDTKMLRKGGELFPVDVILSHHLHGGQVPMVIALVSDVTDRKKQEQKLVEERDLLENVLQSMGDAFVRFDRNWNYTYANEKGLRLIQKTKDEIIGRNIWEVFPHIVGSIFDKEYRKVMDHGHTVSFETQHFVSDMWVEVRACPTADGIAVFFTDLTMRETSKKALLKMNEILEKRVRDRTIELSHALEKEKEINELKSRFVSMASHEFRTPLAAVLSSLHLVEQYTRPEQEEKKLKHISRIKSSVKNLTEILTDFLSVEKLEQGKVESINQHFNLINKIREVTEEMEGYLKKGQKILSVHRGTENVFLDKKILHNILLNLLSNASKYSNEGDAIEVVSEFTGEEIILSVKDKGIGIPIEDQPHLFSRFFRAKNAENIQGTGLGLNIVKKYVELLNGTISFVSHYNTGSVFTIRIPVN